MAVIANRVRAKVGGQRYSKRRKIAWGKIWPHGEFSLSSIDEPVEESTVEEEYAYTVERGAAPLLDSSSEFSQENSEVEPRAKKKNGLKGITAFGRKMVQSGVTLLAKEFGQKKLTFATLTVPPLGREERAALAEGWGEILRQLLQWVSRRLTKQGLKSLVVSVSEIQPKRLRRSGEGYLHAHLVWPNRLRHPSDYSVDVDELRAFWQALIARVVGRTSLPNMQIRLEVVQSNVAGYLAKYMSKGGEGLRQYREDVGDEGVPAQWWNMTKPARDMTKAAVMVGAATGELLETFLEWARDEFSDGEWGRVRAVEKDIDGRTVVLGWYGYLKPPTLEDLTGMLEFRLTEI